MESVAVCATCEARPRPRQNIWFPPEGAARVAGGPLYRADRHSRFGQQACQLRTLINSRRARDAPAGRHSGRPLRRPITWASVLPLGHKNAQANPLARPRTIQAASMFLTDIAGYGWPSLPAWPCSASLAATGAMIAGVAHRNFAAPGRDLRNANPKQYRSFRRPRPRPAALPPGLKKKILQLVPFRQRLRIERAAQYDGRATLPVGVVASARHPTAARSNPRVSLFPNGRKRGDQRHSRSLRRGRRCHQSGTF